MDEVDSQKPTLDEFLRCGQSLTAALTTPEAKQPVSDKMTEIDEKWKDLIVSALCFFALLTKM